MPKRTALTVDDPIFAPVLPEERLYEWSEDDIKVLYQHYPKKGTMWCARKLGLKYNQVRRKAGELELSCYETSSDVEMNIKDLATALGSSKRGLRISLARRAKRDKVLRRAIHSALVPVWWAERLLNANADRQAELECIAAEYYSCPRAAEILGVSPNTIRQSMPKHDENGKLIRDYSGTIGKQIKQMQAEGRKPVHVLYPNGYTSMQKIYFNPWELMELKKRMSVPFNYVTLKSVSIEYGFSTPSLHRAFRDRIITIPTSGGKTAYMPQPTAEEIRRMRANSQRHGNPRNFMRGYLPEGLPGSAAPNAAD